MSRIRHLKDKTKSKDLCYVSFGTALVDDLGLHLKFLRDANEGICIDLLRYRFTTIQYSSYACPFDVGGHSLMSGRVCRLKIPDDLLLHLSLDPLEFLACVICIWLDIIEGPVTPKYCAMCQTGSTFTTGWLRKSNCNDRDKLAKMILSRKLTELLLASKHCLYSQ
jgi:hypothetical protein